MSFIQSSSIAFSEIELRRNAGKNILSFGIDYLDDTMAGILPNDLILIGAGSGMGKTQLCCTIAKANVAKGKRVHYIALEAEYAEIERRIKYQLFMKHFLEDPRRPPGLYITFQQWVLGYFVSSCEKYEALAASEFMRDFTGLFTCYKEDEFNISDFTMKVMECAAETDLIIVDHVHYFDFDGDDENKAIKAIAKTARTLALEQGKPIILVSHLRKRDRHNDDLVPSIEEFHGSSDLYKIATKAITLSGGTFDEKARLETFFCVVKNRYEGSVSRFIGRCVYNSRAGNYEAGYKIGTSKQKRNEPFVELDPVSRPEWVKNANRGICDSFDLYAGASKDLGR